MKNSIEIEVQIQKHKAEIKSLESQVKALESGELAAVATTVGAGTAAVGSPGPCRTSTQRTRRRESSSPAPGLGSHSATPRGYSSAASLRRSFGRGASRPRASRPGPGRRTDLCSLLLSSSNRDICLLTGENRSQSRCAQLRHDHDRHHCYSVCLVYLHALIGVH